jgi:hypothetical protein
MQREWASVPGVRPADVQIRGPIALHVRGDTFLVRSDTFPVLFGCRAAQNS